MIDDVTERRRLEAVRRDFVANISHELKTPVGALGLLAETLLDESDPAVARRLAERMLHEAHRVGRTIDDLLELSRIEAEEPHPTEPVPVHLVVAEAVERVRSAAEQRGTRRSRSPSRRRTVTVLGDRRQLVSAVHNLLDNATKYCEPGSPIEVVARVAAGRVEIDVRDHGVGHPDARPRAHLRALLPRRPGPQPGDRRHRARPRHRPPRRRQPRRRRAGSRPARARAPTFTLSLPAGPGAAVDIPHMEAG